jgi:hypothetical protein
MLNQFFDQDICAVYMYFIAAEYLWVIPSVCIHNTPFLIYLLTDKEIVPKTINDVKLINAGRILENGKTLAESRVPVGEVPGSVITMHVVVQPPQSNKTGIDIISFLSVPS